jgi:hypothetical protein
LEEVLDLSSDRILNECKPEAGSLIQFQFFIALTNGSVKCVTLLCKTSWLLQQQECSSVWGTERVVI